MSYVLFLLRTRAWETEAWETASQRALRNSKVGDLRGEVSIYVILVKGDYMQSSMSIS